MTGSERRELYRRLLRVVSAAVASAARRSSAAADVDDLIGEVWLHLVEKKVLERVDPARGSVEQLVYIAARNRTISVLRARRRVGWHEVLKDDAAFTLDIPAPGPHAVWVALAHRDLARALEHFTEEDREVLFLSLAYDLTAAEIAEVRGEAVNEAKIAATQKRLQRLKEKLNDRLNEIVSTPRAKERSPEVSGPAALIAEESPAAEAKNPNAKEGKR